MHGWPDRLAFFLAIHFFGCFVGKAKVFCYYKAERTTMLNVSCCLRGSVSAAFNNNSNNNNSWYFALCTVALFLCAKFLGFLSALTSESSTIDYKGHGSLVEVVAVAYM